MSLVPTYVKVVDGNYYENPVLCGMNQFEGSYYRWFICFDDDDPPEIVITESKPIAPQTLRKFCGMILNQLGIKFRWILGEGWERSLRSHTIGGSEYFLESINFFFVLRSPIPIPVKYGKVVSADQIDSVGECVFYTGEEN